MARAMRIIGPPQACILLPLLARLPVGSARIFHQLNELRYEEEAAPLPTEHLTNVDHLSTSVQGDPRGSTDWRKGTNRLSTGVNGGH
jgi:hypothetical protein